MSDARIAETFSRQLAEIDVLRARMDAFKVKLEAARARAEYVIVVTKAVVDRVN